MKCFMGENNVLGIGSFSRLSEQQLHTIRWALTGGWLVMIVSLFWDPFSAYLTAPNHPVSPLRLDPSECILVQGQCLAQQPYSIAAYVFWTFVVPGSILVLLVFGHETWRRICPLAFLSQIPRALGLQRKRKVSSGKGATKYELVKVRRDSWLSKHHLYVQFALLTVGLVARLLLLNSSRLALGIFLLLTILAAIAVGYLYAGKSWCQYFCPMAPVQLVFTGLRGLLGSEAHQGTQQALTQSMCRTVDSEGKEKSACVGCQSPCIDIDAERSYWGTFTEPGRKFTQYGYVGLLLGFFVYYFLYAGSFDYLFSGAWLREADQGSTLFAPGFYLGRTAIPIPKLVAVPLTLVLFTVVSFYLLMGVERTYRGYLLRQHQTDVKERATHVIFSVCTFFCFNAFFFFSSRAVLSQFPFPIYFLFNGFIVLVSTLWLSRTLGRSAEVYNRENLANSLRRQLSKLSIDFSRFLEGRSMNDLKAEEVYVLAKVIPGVSQDQSLQVYKGVLRETIEQGTADSASSLEFLRPIRQELNIKDEDHFAVLTELSSIDPDLLDPRRRHSRENQLRTESYRQALASMLFDLVDSGLSLQEAMQRQRKQIQFLKLEYGMTSEEEDEVLSQILAGEKQTILRKAEVLLGQLQELALQDQALSSQKNSHPLFKLLRLVAVQHKQEIITKQMLGLLEMLQGEPEAVDLAIATRQVAGTILTATLQTLDHAVTWKQRLAVPVWAALEGPLASPDAATPAHKTTGECLPQPTVAPEKFAIAPVEAAAELPPNTESATAIWALLEGQPTQPPTAPANAAQETVSAAQPSAAPAPLDAMISPQQPLFTVAQVSLDPAKSLTQVLSDLLDDLDPLIQALALHGLNLLDPQSVGQRAKQLLPDHKAAHWLVQETVQTLKLDRPEVRQTVQTLTAQVVLADKSERRVFQKPVVRIGRSPINDIVLPHPAIALNHAVLYLEQDAFSILDVSGAAGVYVDGQHLQGDAQRLKQGQCIRLGQADQSAITVTWAHQPLYVQTVAETMSTVDKVLLLFESQFFQSLKPDVLVELGRHAAVQVYPYQTSLCQAQAPSDSILLLIDGTAQVVVLQGETQQVVGTVHAGETIGEMGVLTRQRRSASVVSASDQCRALVIQADAFDAVLRQDPEVARNLLIILSSRLQTMTQKVATTSHFRENSAQNGQAAQPLRV